jgi:hypothetical protein
LYHPLCSQEIIKGLSYSLNRIYEIRTPVVAVKEKKIIHNLVLVFDKVPRNYWVNYKKNSNRISMECYGASIERKPYFQFSSRGVFRDLTIKKESGVLALPGQRSDIVIEIAPDTAWHVKDSVKGDSMVVLTVWRDIQIKAPESNKSSRRIMRVDLFVGLIFALLTTGIIGTFTKDNF